MSYRIRNSETKWATIGICALVIGWIAFIAFDTWRMTGYGARFLDTAQWVRLTISMLLASAVSVVVVMQLASQLRFGDVDLEIEGKIALGENISLSFPVPPQLKHGDIVKVAVICTVVEYQGRHSEKTERWRSDHAVTVPAQGIPRLAVQVSLPTGLPHSMRIPSGHVEWSVQLHCDLPGADLVRNFELPVARAYGAGHLPG